GLGSMFRGVSDIPLRATQILHKLFQSAQGKASEDALKEIQTLMKIRDKLKERGGNLRDLVRQIYQKDDKDQLVNKLIDKFDRKFYSEVEAKAQAGGDLAWIKDNIDLEAYEVEAKAAMDKWIASIRRTMPSENADDLLAIERAILKVKQKFDISRKDFNGWNNYILKRHPKAKWYSTEYQSLLKDPDLLELYNVIVDFNEKAGEIGYIQNKIART